MFGCNKLNIVYVWSVVASVLSSGARKFLRSSLLPSLWALPLLSQWSLWSLFQEYKINTKVTFPLPKLIVKLGVSETSYARCTKENKFRDRRWIILAMSFVDYDSTIPNFVSISGLRSGSSGAFSQYRQENTKFNRESSGPRHGFRNWSQPRRIIPHRLQILQHFLPIFFQPFRPSKFAFHVSQHFPFSFFVRLVSHSEEPHKQSQKSWVWMTQSWAIEVHFRASSRFPSLPELFLALFCSETNLFRVCFAVCNISITSLRTVEHSTTNPEQKSAEDQCGGSVVVNSYSSDNHLLSV